MSEIKMVG